MTANFKDGIFPAALQDIFRNNHHFDINQDVAQRTAQTSASIIPTQNSTTFNQKLSNGSQTNMNVDGSVEPVEFTLVFPEPEPDTVNYITGISLVMVFAPIDSYADYGSLPPLTNGCEVKSTRQGNDVVHQIIKTSSDWLLFFNETEQVAQTGNSSEGMISGSIGTEPSKVIEDDSFTVTIRDDLSSIVTQEMMIHTTRVFL